MNHAIEVKNISFSYGKNKKALDQISLQVEQGKIFGLLGPNGGGKTTLFKIISSMIRSYEGEVLIEGQSLKNNLSHVLPKLGVVFQSPSLDKKLTVEENLIYHGYLYGYSPKELSKRMDHLLDMLSVRDRKNDLVQELSGGLARRVEIVKSLLHSPKILILDEPSSGLDIAVRIDLWNMLKNIQADQKMTVLLTTHFIEEADRCDQIVLLNQGKVLSSGSPNELKSKLSFKWFQVKPKDANATKELLKSQFKIDANPEHGFLQFKADPSQARAIADSLASQVEELTYRDPSLEDVFVQYAGHKLVEGAKA